MWKDTTSYSQNDDRTPTTWTLKAGDLRITVTSGHIAYRGTGAWVMHCDPFYNTFELKGVKTAEDAQKAAIEMVRKKLAAVVAAFPVHAVG